MRGPVATPNCSRMTRVATKVAPTRMRVWVRGSRVLSLRLSWSVPNRPPLFGCNKYSVSVLLTCTTPTMRPMAMAMITARVKSWNPHGEISNEVTDTPQTSRIMPAVSRADSVLQTVRTTVKARLAVSARAAAEGWVRWPPKLKTISAAAARPAALESAPVAVRPGARQETVVPWTRGIGPQSRIPGHPA